MCACVLSKQPTVLTMVVCVRAFAGFIARARLRRRAEVGAWERMKSERVFLLSLIYSGLVIISVLLLYVCLLYGVKFEARQMQSWVIGSLVGFATDIIVQQPLVELLKVFIALSYMLCRKSLRLTVIHSLAARRDMLRIQLYEAQMRERAAGGAAAADTSGQPARVEVHRVGIPDLLEQWKGRRSKR